MTDSVDCFVSQISARTHCSTRIGTKPLFVLVLGTMVFRLVLKSCRFLRPFNCRSFKLGTSPFRKSELSLSPSLFPLLLFDFRIVHLTEHCVTSRGLQGLRVKTSPRKKRRRERRRRDQIHAGPGISGKPDDRGLSLLSRLPHTFQPAAVQNYIVQILR